MAAEDDASFCFARSFADAVSVVRFFLGCERVKSFVMENKLSNCKKNAENGERHNRIEKRNNAEKLSGKEKSRSNYHQNARHGNPAEECLGMNGK